MKALNDAEEKANVLDDENKVPDDLFIIKPGLRFSELCGLFASVHYHRLTCT